MQGLIPPDAIGKKYQIIVHANTNTAGNSDSITIPLQISIDKSKTPAFKSAKPILPIVYPGQPYAYDFVQAQDIIPEYEAIPYDLKFADAHQHPYWLQLKNNCLTAEHIPELEESIITIYLVLKNIPGGESAPIPVQLTVMH